MEFWILLEDGGDYGHRPIAIYTTREKASEVADKLEDQICWATYHVTGPFKPDQI